jgi:predicted RNase H-like HicB family nuclease
MKKAIMLHIEGLREDNLPVPKPSTSVGYITVAS